MCSSLTHEIGKWDNQAVYPSSDAEAAQQAEAAKIEAVEIKKACSYAQSAGDVAVSYTHLTLPTKLSV